MATIHLQLSTSKSFISWAIRRMTWSDFSHVDTVLPAGFLADGKDVGGWLLGAHIEDGVRIRKPDYCKFAKTQRYRIECTDEQAKKYYEYMVAQVGKPYDKAAIFGFAIHRDWFVDWKDERKWFCSEVVAAGLRHAGIAFLNFKANRVSPRDLTLLSILIPE